MNISERIKQVMEEKKFNQKQLSQKSGITEASLSKYINGTRIPRIDALARISKALCVDINNFLDLEPITQNAYFESNKILTRCKDQLTEEEKKKLIKFLLED